MLGGCVMKKVIITKVMNYIKKYNNYSDTELAEIEYGLVSIYLTLSKLIIIAIFAIILGIFKEMVLFSSTLMVGAYSFFHL